MSRWFAGVFIRNLGAKLKIQNSILWPSLFLCFFVSLRVCTLCRASLPEFDLGFLACRDTDLEGNARLRVLGPFFERRAADDGKTFIAVRPFFSSAKDDVHERSLNEFLWPVGMIKKYHGETYWRFLTAFGHDFDNTDTDSRSRMIVFPILFAGRDKNQEKYFAVFPLGGKINEFLGRDRIIFGLFPLYAFSSVDDVATHDILWPLISWTEGKDIERFRVSPFYGKSEKRGQCVKKFVLWPLWTSVRYESPDCSGGGFILFPVLGHIAMTDQVSWMVLPPLFRWSSSENGTEVNCPWPILQYSSGAVKKFYIWPLWGRRSSAGIRTSFFLWPIVFSLRADREDCVVNRFTILPLVFYESRVKKGSGFPPEVDPPSEDRVPASADTTLRSSSLRSTRASAGRQGSGLEEQSLDNERLPEAGTPNREPRTVNEERPTASARHFKLWPFISYRREGEATRVRALDLWPARDKPSIEKNIAPFWTLYSHVRIGDAKEDELLWGLLRYRRDALGSRNLSLFPIFYCRSSQNVESTREWNLLLGLAGYKQEGLRKTYRLLYFIKW